jgi:hypothetical protein
LLDSAWARRLELASYPFDSGTATPHKVSGDFA